MSKEDSCFGDFPFDRECDRATCLDLCEDVEECKKTTKEREQ